MTDILLDPNDTGEIPRPVGETLTRVYVTNVTNPGEATEELSRYLRPDAPFGHLRRQIELDDTVVYMPATIGVVGLDDKPHPKPPHPLPPNPKYDMAAAQPIAPWERIVDTDRLTLLGTFAGVDGELRPADYVGRHRDPQDRHAIPGEAHRARMVDAVRPAGEPRGVRLAVAGFVGFAALVTFTVLAVFW